MTNETFDDNQLQLPIGKFEFDGNLTNDKIQEWVEDLKDVPGNIRREVKHLSTSDLETKYRKEGWSIRQTVHHIADAYMHSYIHFKLALTENNPTIKPYEESLWAQWENGDYAPIDPSLDIIEQIANKWMSLLESMQEDDFRRTFHHPSAGQFILGSYLGFCAWHGRHHLAHIRIGIKKAAKG